MILHLMSSILDLSGTVISLQPTTQPGAIAEVVMDNVYVNGVQDNGTSTLTMDGLSVAVTFEWDAGEGGSDAITVTPPDGIVCVPADCILIVPEEQSGALYLYDWQGS